MYDLVKRFIAGSVFYRRHPYKMRHVFSVKNIHADVESSIDFLETSSARPGQDLIPAVRRLLKNPSANNLRFNANCRSGTP